MSPSYIIVGAGIFGISTAYHLLKADASATITIVDRDAFDSDNRVAASWDWNKVMRADYDDATYCALAVEAQDIFERDALWRPYFHRTGLYWMCGTEYAARCCENLRRLGRGDDVAVYSVDEARRLFGGLFDGANYEGVDQVLVNKASGWVAAGECLQAVTREVMRLGAKYVAEEVASMVVQGGRCTGVRTVSGREMRAERVVLCTGAFTSKLLEVSDAKGRLSAGGRIVAGGITTGMTLLDEESRVRFADMPVGIQGFTATKAPFVGSLPPTKDGELKWWGEKIFRNTTEILPGRFLSTPPAGTDYAQWKISEKLKDDVLAASGTFYGRDAAAKWKYIKHRICWDAFTTSSDFIISPHAAAKGLYIATCGSFHGFKFFPIIGKYVVQMLEGTLSSQLAQRWAWDRERPDPADNVDWPSMEMKELLDPVGGSRL